MSDLKRICDFLKECKVYYIATVDGDQPRVRPFATVNIFEDKLYIQTGKSKNVFHQIHHNPKVELCGCLGDKWIRIAGTLVEDDRKEPQETMLDAYPALKAAYHAGDGNTVVLYLKQATAVFYSRTGKPETVKF